MTCWQITHFIWVDVRQITSSNSIVIWKYKVPCNGRLDKGPIMKLGRDLDSTWISKKSDGWSVEINVCSIHKGRPSMVRFNKPKNNLSQENEAKTRRTIFNYQSTGTGYLQVATSSDLVNPWHLPCCVTATIQGEWDLWRELCEATSRVGGRRRGLQSGNNPKSQEKRTRLSIIWQMAGISNHWCLVGTRTCVFKWWWHIDTLQTST